MPEPIPTPRELVDPNGTLPAVTLVRDPSANDPYAGMQRHESNILMVDGTQVGKAVVGRDLKKNEAWFNGVEVDKKGKGYGTAAYLAAIEQAHANGETFRSHEYGFSPEAAKVWQKFVDAGVAQVVVPLENVTFAGGVTGEAGAKINIGHVQIPPPELH